MKFSSTCGVSFFVALGVSVLTGCNNGATQFSPSTRSLAQIAPLHKKETGLLYVSDESAGTIYVYSYPRTGLKQTLTGFTTPIGECVDKAGHVFIVDEGTSKIYEYAHGGSGAIQTLDDSGYDPVDCAENPVNGDLAVTNVYDVTQKHPGNVVIYKGAKGKPKAYYTDSSLPYLEFCGYDPKGNLYVDGSKKLKRYRSGFAELPNGKTTFTAITLNQKIRGAGGIQWDGKHIAIGDFNANVIYQFAFKGNKGTQIGSTPLVGALEVVLFWIGGNRVIGADFKGADVGFWSYPSGGPIRKALTGFSAPVGVVVSP